MTKHFLIQNIFDGLSYIVAGSSPIDAFAKWSTNNGLMTKDWFVTRKDLLKRGFRAMNTTRLKGVWELVK